MAKYDVIIIGAGLSGLECGAVLSAEGRRVLLMEQGEVSGGFFQPFRRRGVKIDSSVHYAGSLDKGQFLHSAFTYMGVMDKLKLVRMNSRGFDVICTDGESYDLPIGHEQFVESLSARFPHEAKGIRDYSAELHRTGGLSIQSIRSGGGFSPDGIDAISTSAYDKIASFVQDPVLRRVLAGNSIIYGGIKEVTPFYVHAISNNSYIESSYRFADGADTLTTALEQKIIDNGGEIRFSSGVKSIITSNGEVCGVLSESGEITESEWVISTIHPSLTLEMLNIDSGIKNSYRERITALRNSCGLFCLYLLMKPGSYPYRNKNYHILGEKNVMVSFQPPVNESAFAEVVTLIRQMDFSEVEQWSESYTGKRDSRYSEFKEKISEEMMERAEQILPGLREAVQARYSATPLTFRDYVNTPQGSAYGIMKNYNAPLSTFIPVKTRVKNLLLAGQSINVHGVMGVTVTSLLACCEIIGPEYLSEKMMI